MPSPLSTAYSTQSMVGQFVLLNRSTDKQWQLDYTSSKRLLSSYVTTILEINPSQHNGKNRDLERKNSNNLLRRD